MIDRNEVLADWHPEIIKAELHLRGLTFRKLSIEAGYKPDSLKSVLRIPCVKYEGIVAAALGVSPEVIWPSRYAARNNSYIRRAS
ncbi:helix-turn-helix domain-containing protein [Salmonella enterica]|nr:DNA-binding protein [Salmonella enterica]EFV1946843.1 DNA-binding protein [Salmonella enterica]EGX8700590.1 DNA-binding protein [Salmonella enterica]EHX3140937.1 helix-turn-helix domain-containing protein [Salmonella enterica]EIL2348497.1 helix-turn-helix domain-containing protein [Salmonella enterica]